MGYDRFGGGYNRTAWDMIDSAADMTGSALDMSDFTKKKPLRIDSGMAGNVLF
ncbi:hypothetical protein [Sporosarcina psychrophila]|uniref:hypothetical protein n=1 Tax=Sporosarcina psychrophila TaxID=1476 RepID=UPI000AC1C8C6|nr:hypothetical protein [Sporosarcina psychrophila]